MTLRANITTTYRDVNASTPRVTKNVQKEMANQGIHESESPRNPMKPAAKAPDQGAVSPTKHWPKERSAARNDGRPSATVDAFERGSPKDKSVAAQGARPDNPASDWHPDTDERKAPSKPALAGYGPGSGGPIIKMIDKESPASQKYSAPVADRSPDEHSGNMVKSLAPTDPPKSGKGQENWSSGQRSKALDSLSQSLPVAALPKIHLAEPSAKAATGDAVASSSAVEMAPASVPTERSDQSPTGVMSMSGLSSTSTDEDDMQREITAALQFGQVQEDNSQIYSATSIDVAKHLQSEGVFGISSSGRNLGTVDFIRQKQFEYTMDQKPFSTDDLLLEAEKAIHGTLNSDQSSAVSKSLLQAAESVNAYRNQSVRSSENGAIAAKPVRVAASTGKEDA